jgi:hypothetical protein
MCSIEDRVVKGTTGSVLYELPYLWKSVDNKMVSHEGFSGYKLHSSCFPQQLQDMVRKAFHLAIKRVVKGSPYGRHGHLLTTKRNTLSAVKTCYLRLSKS